MSFPAHVTRLWAFLDAGLVHAIFWNGRPCRKEYSPQVKSFAEAGAARAAVADLTAPTAGRAGAAGPNGTDAPLHLGGRGCAARQFATTVPALPGRAARTRCWRRQLLSGPPPPALPPPPCAGGAGATGPSGADAPPPKEGRAARTTAVRTGPPHALPLPLPAGQADAPLGKHGEPRRCAGRPRRQTWNTVP